MVDLPGNGFEGGAASVYDHMNRRGGHRFIRDESHPFRRTYKDCNGDRFTYNGRVIFLSIGSVKG